ncbi:MAG: PD-(D/E)XK nuclease family protein [Puniceicoccales bacterium]|nr:PD-(D/E)XK nuclease family protein [Puniceicoccales bacterium]
MYTPMSLRQELLKVRHLDWQLLPETSLIPWQIENGFSPMAIREIQQLRPEDRSRLYNNSILRRAESEKLFTVAALDSQLCSAACHDIWDQFFSVGFPECSWENHKLLLAAAKCSTAAEYFFELSPKSPSLARWRMLWNYQPDDDIPVKTSNTIEVYTTENVSDFTSVILGKIASLLGRNDSSLDGKIPKIAIGFSGRGARYHAIRQMLEITRIPFLDLLVKGKTSEWSPLWQRWLEYQRRQKRDECLALLDCKFALGMIEEVQWNTLRKGVLEHSRGSVTDDCAETLPTKIKEWVQPLPMRGKAEEFHMHTVEVFPQTRCLEPDVQILDSLYDAITRDGFLDWLETAREDRFCEISQKNWSANIHIVNYDDLPFGDYSCVICGDLESIRLNNHAELFDVARLEGINESLEDFYYDFSKHVIPQELVIRSALGHSREVTIVAIGDTASCDVDMPVAIRIGSQLDSNEMRERMWYLRHLGVFLGNTGTAAKMKNDETDLCNDDIARCVNAYHMRRDATKPFGVFDFGAGGDEKWREKLLQFMPCKAWELAFTCPEDVWMRQILSIELPAKSIFGEISMATGLCVHAELTKKFTQSFSDANSNKHSMREGLVEKSYITHNTHHQSLGIMKALERQTRMVLDELELDSIKTEQNISGFIKAGSARIWTHGRVDLVANDGNHYCIIDFKTRSSGAAFTAKQISQGKFLQIILYGLYYQCAGRTVDVLVLSPFHREMGFEISKLKPKDMEKLNAFFANFEKFQRFLTFGYGTSGRFLAHAHSALPAHIIAARRNLSA